MMDGSSDRETGMGMATSEALTMEMREPWHRDLILGMLASCRDVNEWASSMAYTYSKSGTLEVTALIIAMRATIEELEETIPSYLRLTPGNEGQCSCDHSPESGGPEQDCPEHGDVRWYAHWLTEATAEIERLKGGREIEQTMLANVLPTLADNAAENEALRAEVESLRAFQLQHRRSL